MNRRTIIEGKQKENVINDKFRIHDLRKDPTDLPKNGEIVLIYTIYACFGKKFVIYNTVKYFDGFNCAENSKEYEMKPTAWRRLETVEELG